MLHLLLVILKISVEHSLPVKTNTQFNPAPIYCCALSGSNMEKVSLPYSAKNIPVPNRNVYQQMLISKSRKFVHNARWKAYFYLKPSAKPKSKENYGFKSTAPAPSVLELKIFEDRIANLVKNVKFDRSPNHFQKTLKIDEKKIKSDPRAFIKADKSTNYYKMDTKDYKKLVEKEIHKEYKKVDSKEIKSVEETQKVIVSKLDLQERVFAAPQRQCFASLKDHKENFENNPKVRLINPSKLEVQKISKFIVERVNKTIRSKTGLNQWTSTADVIKWFRKIEKKKSKKFIQIDVINFYPSISEELLKMAIEWAKQFIDISLDEEEIILKSKRAILFNEGLPWGKKGLSNFDVAQGSYDGAECAELVGLFILAEVAKIDRIDPGIYRDDFLAVTPATPMQAEAIKKKIVEKFSEYGLGTTAEANITVVDFLDVTFNLKDETFKPYCKPNNVPQYVNKSSNHPPTVLRNIPANVNKRLSSISSNEKMFESAAPRYQEAINSSGYDYKLKFDPTASEPNPKSRNRKRNILWFNPPWNSTVSTNIGKEFLNLLDECFPPTHPLRKILNRKNVKVSYSTTPNMEKIISGKNAKVLNTAEDEARKCNCPKNKECPLDKKCLESCIVYQATVTQPNQEPKTYIGLTSTDFKARLGNHKQSFSNPDVNQTSLSKYVIELKNKGLEPTVSWKLVDRGKKFSPVTGNCQLCTKEAYYIIFKPEMAELNSRSEIFSTCRHKKSALLFKPITKSTGKKRKSPGT
jgi:hypothetical protein